MFDKVNQDKETGLIESTAFENYLGTNKALYQYVLGLADTEDLDVNTICKKRAKDEPFIYNVQSTISYFRDWINEFGLTFVNWKDDWVFYWAEVSCFDLQEFKI